MGHSFFKLCSAVLLAAACLVSSFAAPENSNAATAKSLPDNLADFRARGLASSTPNEPKQTEDSIISRTTRTYISRTGNTFVVVLTQTKMDSAAYSLLTAAVPAGQQMKLGAIGTASAADPHMVVFFKGNNFVKISPADSAAPNNSSEVELYGLAVALAEQFDRGENDIPVLIKHLPNWETVQAHASYFVSLQALKELLPQQRVLDAVSFEGSAEAALANYDAGKLLIIEFNTAKIAADNDWNIKTKIAELRGAGANANALPSAYRRVGNYSVFVFDAPSEPVANELIDQVKYQQVVQWLGNDPYVYERATREFTETTLGVFVSVVKASGLAWVTCLGVGGLFGALLFSRRRTRTRNVDAYSDAGGMLRLNLDEMTPETDPSRLIGPGVR
ncbi:MAG: hypothetical protein QOF62_1694 [Pyrinomonadaceae bacterium]|nr:hypothetical protein [Pyrinomonadaceae bacterium]